tara:strand:- start:85 stop:240 length:156 start_codon:yes stop_codon:yes gene_type:complete
MEAEAEVVELMVVMLVQEELVAEVQEVLIREMQLPEQLILVVVEEVVTLVM